MSSKKVIIKNEKIWFHSSKKTSYIPEKRNSEYMFRETKWSKGVIIDSIVNEDTRLITRAPNKTFADLSLTKTTDGEWGKRKIIHTIKVKVEKNVVDIYNDAISFSLVQVKKDMFDGLTGSSVSNPIYWCENQLINEPQNNMFSTSIEFDNLLYDLAEDEDFALIQDITFKNNFLMTGSKKYATAIKPYVNYETIIIYSNSYM